MNDQNCAKRGTEYGAAIGSISGSAGFSFGGADMRGEAFGSRQNARSAIRDRIEQMRREACRLEALLDALPVKLPPDADQALWDLAIAARRG
jgi:hypothetical protein